MPHEGELFGRVIKLVGGDNIIVKSNDGKVRTCRIRGKIKKDVDKRQRSSTNCAMGFSIR